MADRTRKAPPDCTYDRQGEGPFTGPTAAGIPEDCSGPVTHQVLNYYRGRTAKAIGPHMPLCTAHADWWALLHPFSPPPVKRRAR